MNGFEASEDTRLNRVTLPFLFLPIERLLRDPVK